MSDEELINEIIKRIPLKDGNGNHATNKDNLLEMLDIFIDEWNRLEDKEDEEIEFASINWVRRSEYEKLQKENAMLKAKIEDSRKRYYAERDIDEEFE